MDFLKAEWRKLAIANFEVDPTILEKYLPNKTELDIWEGKCYVSLVGFMFQNTKLLGFPIPFHRHFEEVNLRFYVKYFDNSEWKRGVVFIKEIVPKHALTFVANTVYKEHYETMKMKHFWKHTSEHLQVEYAWKTKKHNSLFKVKASGVPQEIEENSKAEFITEHYWGYTRVDEETTYEYEVTHPRWQVYEVSNFKVAVDFAAVYGSEFECLNHQTPTSVMLAEGSEIAVKNKRRI